MSILIKCEICGKEYSHKGIHTHMQRAHGTDEEKSKYSNGNNGKYDDPSYKEKISQSRITLSIKKNGLKVDLHLKCQKCGADFVKVDYELRRNQYRFCSRSCANSRNHSDDTKLKISEKLLKIVNTADFKQKISKRCSSKKILKKMI